MTDKPDVYMPLFIGDYLAGTARLTTELHGAYLLLIMDYWMNGPLPDDDAILSSITKMSADAWSIARAVLAQFFNIEEGVWKHGRIEKELAEATEKKRKSKEKAAKAANARWGNASSNAQAMLKECPSPSPSPIGSKEPKKTVTKAVRKPESFKCFFTAYPENKRGGRDTSAWKKAKSLNLTDQDFENMLVDLAKRKELTPSWFTTYAPGICKYLEEHIWKTTVIPEAPSAETRPNGNPATAGRKLTPAERTEQKREAVRQRELAQQPPPVGPVVAVQ